MMEYLKRKFARMKSQDAVKISFPQYYEENGKLIKELENRPVMVKYQQVNFNQESVAKPKETKKKPKKQIVESDKLTINRGYQINKIPTD